MLTSLPVTANFIFKLHVSALEAPRENLSLYPVMDGVFVVAQDRFELRRFLTMVIARLADLFVGTPDNEHRFLVKCSIAFGGVIHGRDIPVATSYSFKDNGEYKDSILLGMPMVNAVQGEPRAAAFGVFVHDSAGEFLSPPERKRSHVWWPWFLPDQRDCAKALRIALPEYFAWCEDRAGALDYDPSRIRLHRQQAAQYLVDA